MGTYKTAFSFLLIVLYSCSVSPGHSEKEVVAAMHRYDQLILKKDADSIALLYSPEGELVDAAKGRDAIRNFLKSFGDVRVLSNRSTTDTVTVTGDTARLTGMYSQVVVLNDGDTLHLLGSYQARWVYLPKEGWRIDRMETTPVPNP